MYNAELKQRYLDTLNVKEVVITDLIYKFNKAESIEQMFKKDLHEFSTREILGMYKMWSTSSLEFLMVCNSNYAGYVDYCLSAGLVSDGRNHFRELTLDNLSTCINLGISDNKIFTRDQVLKLTSELANPSDAFLILALFEGVSGFGYEDLFYAEMSQFEGFVMHCHSGRTIPISKELITYARKASDDYVYYCFTKDGEELVKNLDMTDKRILKRQLNAKVYDVAPYATTNQRIRIRLERIRKSLGLNVMTGKSLIESGRVDMIKGLMAKDGAQDPERTIFAHRDIIENKYGTLASVRRWVLRYGGYCKEG